MPQSKEERKAVRRKLEVRKRDRRRAAQQEEAQRRAVPPAQPEMILTAQREHEEVLAPHRLAVTSPLAKCTSSGLK
ncbi:uncharacterized protein N7515_007318 [Penicillium bovifimosum]|uniref:Uncharacterized protein n=1 Tax=Penicillium bovifimosum TaxID=126998 RepID=A0A9W9GWE2_9EURO|nr:uncharacterized protein N7515_007318 [Penicillium bovifimosum]KAJ5131279.1 hypothetical protein N7515_007318 [Penicillium bovifimosum]